MANKRKQHLKYQAKKGRLVPAEEVITTSVGASAGNAEEKVAGSVESSASVVKNTAKSSSGKSDISKLPQSEVAFVRRELIYLLFVALVLLALYLVIWVVFKYTTIDEYLYSLIKLKS